MTANNLLMAVTATMLIAFPATPKADIYLIAHPDVDLSGGDVYELFIGEKQVAGSTRLVPIDNSPRQREFLSKVLKLSAGKYETLWTKKSFREGLNAPAIKGSDSEVLGVVKKTPGAIGYVGVIPAGVKVIQKY